MAAAPDRVGVMVLRAWTESPPNGLRVRVASTLDISGDEETNTVVLTVSEAVELVRTWLETFVRENGTEVALVWPSSPR